jgi:hypothetical protein
MERRAPTGGDFGVLAVAAGLMVMLVAVSSPRAATPLGDTGQAWAGFVQQVDAALGQGDIRAAERSAQQAYMSALGSRGWEGMVAAGDAYRRIGEASGARSAVTMKAREAYLTALMRARQQQSLAGVSRAAEAFAALGDRELVNRCIRVAETVAGQIADPQAREQARASVERLANRLLALERQ